MLLDIFFGKPCISKRSLDAQSKSTTRPSPTPNLPPHVGTFKQCWQLNWDSARNFEEKSLLSSVNDYGAILRLYFTLTCWWFKLYSRQSHYLPWLV